MRVRVRTPARLHLGLIDLRGDLGRTFGGLGLAIDKPNVVVEASSSDKLQVLGNEQKGVEQAIEKICSRYELEPRVRVQVIETIPKHVGLGSTTQLVLAVGKAVASILRIPADTWELAKVLERGRVSSIGIAAFERGGFVINGGVRPGAGVPPVIARFDFPEEWAFVVAIPKLRLLFDEEREAAAFSSLPPMEESVTSRICRLILVKMLPALVERDIRSFGEALTEIQTLVGDYFAPAQGGRYSSQASARCAELMLSEGAFGVGQSSWGPAVYGLTTLDRAEFLKQRVERELREGCVFVAQPNNRGAEVILSDY